MDHESSSEHARRRELAARMTGPLPMPRDDPYDKSRAPWNARFAPRPGIARCVDAPAGNTAADDGLLIDPGALKSVSIDAASRRATVGAGVTWGEFDEEAQKRGLATSGGTLSTVGVAGLTLLWDATAPYANGGVYVNLLGEDESDRVRAAYGANYDRLARIKRTRACGQRLPRQPRHPPAPIATSGSEPEAGR